MMTYKQVQCKHEIARDKCFRSDMWDTFWHQMDKVGHSFNVSPSYHNDGKSTESDAHDESNNDEQPSVAYSKSAMDNSIVDEFDDASFEDLCNSDIPVNTGKKHKKHFKVLKCLSEEIIDAVSCNEDMTESVAGVLSFVLHAIKNNNVEEETKEDCLRRYLSQFSHQTRANQSMFSGSPPPVPRTVSQQPGNVTQRMKSNAEEKCRTKPHTPSTSPVPGKGRSKRSCKFCGCTDHTSWKQCQIRGKAATLRGTVVEGTGPSYRSFIDQISHPSWFIVDTILSSNTEVLNKIPTKCRHVIVNSILQVPLPDGSTSSLGQYEHLDPRRRVAKLQLLDKQANTLEDYNNRCFDMKALINWVIVSASFKQINKRLFHRLRTIEINS